MKTVYGLLCHLVVVTKDRREVLDEIIAKRLEQIVRDLFESG
ncbi:transposase [Hydrogenimonas cancrithermarum]